MKKVAIVYWSGTGNTEKMAEAVSNGAKNAGAEVDMVEAVKFDGSKVGEYDAVGFGCPAMGAEVLEEEEFEPMFASVENSLNGKKIGIFGSYDWGDGQWMRDWEERVNAIGANLAKEPVTCNNEPDSDGIKACEELGKALAE